MSVLTSIVKDPYNVMLVGFVEQKVPVHFILESVHFILESVSSILPVSTVGHRDLIEIIRITGVSESSTGFCQSVAESGVQCFLPMQQAGAQDGWQADGAAERYGVPICTPATGPGAGPQHPCGAHDGMQAGIGGGAHPGEHGGAAGAPHPGEQPPP